jgi:hypothetical protein
MKIKQKQEVHFLWYITLGLLTLIPLVLITFTSGTPEITSINIEKVKSD